MNQEEQYSFSPLDSYQWVKKEAFAYIESQQWIEEVQFKDFLNAFGQCFNGSLEKVSYLIKNELDEGNVRFAILVVALYNAFVKIGKEEKDAFQYVSLAINEPIASFMEQNTEAFLSASDNPFKEMVEISKAREVYYFGKSFVFERRIDDAYGYVLQIKRCLFHEVLKALEHTFLQRIICQVDCGWIKGIKPEQHNLQFVRPTTFATGNDCQMWFVKQEKIKEIR
ncbi:hypothetical protein RCZ04_09350 [Capnocytophaga sp. HP1101]